jgi:aminopeptidase
LNFDSELSPGARNAVVTCLRVQPSEKATVITDEACREIAAALTAELERAGARYNQWVLEELAPRPLAGMPRVVLDDLETSQVSIFAVQAQPNELKTRMQMTEVVNRRKIRHGHMVNIDRRIMLEGMRADFLEVDRISTKVWRMASAARSIRATTPAGTGITAELTPEYKWLKTSGIISPNKWGNLPGGETFTTPLEVNGTYVIDGVVGDYLCAKYGDLREAPLTIRVEGNRLKEAHSGNRALEDEFWKYTHTDENSDRVGEFAIGTNIGVRDVIGNILQDEKIPGVHIAFGNPYGDHTGAKWYSSTHIDVVGRNFDIWVDGLQIMHGGRFIEAALG